LLGELTGGVPVVNCAMGGRSTKSFISEGRLVGIEKQLRPGDLMLIQFAHNDESDLVWRHTDPWTSYINNLAIFVDTARLYKAVPVLMTPICMRLWQDGQLAESHGDYIKAVHYLAEQRNVPLIDMYGKSRELAEKLGEEGSRTLFMHLEKGAYPAFPEGREDNAHTQRAGAAAFARIAAEELKRLNLIRESVL
jgi:lysophospholipase L1-like esterase